MRMHSPPRYGRPFNALLCDLVERDVAAAVRAVIAQRHLDLVVDLFRFGWQPSGLLPVALAGFAARCGRIRFLLTSGERRGLPFPCGPQPSAYPARPITYALGTHAVIL
ncbi:MAG: hypothetical protein ACRD0K_16975 [Egibacteraceae bacterium]